MQDDKLIISVEQVRKLASGCLDSKSEEEVQQIITELDFLAELFLMGVVASKEEADKNKESDKND